MKHIVISLVIAICCSIHNSPTVLAQDLYSVLYNHISQYNQDPAQADWIARAILYASSQYNVDPVLIAAIMENESSFSYQAISNVGAIGLMQLMPKTAEMIGVNPHDPLENVMGGTIYLKNQLDHFSSWGEYAVTDAVAAYNAGPGAVINYQGVPPYEETRNYIISVANSYNRLSEQIQY